MRINFDSNYTFHPSAQPTGNNPLRVAQNSPFPISIPKEVNDFIPKRPQKAQPIDVESQFEIFYNNLNNGLDPKKGPSKILLFCDDENIKMFKGLVAHKDKYKVDMLDILKKARENSPQASIIQILKNKDVFTKVIDRIEAKSQDEEFNKLLEAKKWWFYEQIVKGKVDYLLKP